MNKNTFTILPTFLLGFLLGILFGLSLAPSGAEAAEGEPSTHLVGVNHNCGNETTDYRITLRNLGDTTDTARVRVRWIDTGFVQFSWETLAPGESVTEKLRLEKGERAVLRVRSGGRLMASVYMLGDCPSKTSPGPIIHYR